MVLLKIYNNVNDILGRCPSKMGNNTYKLTYFGVMFSFFAGVFTVSGLISYTLCVNYGSYFSDIRKKILDTPNPFSFGFHNNWFGSISNKISR